MEIPRLTVKKILNHVELEITAVYDRHSYDSEKREALEVWADRLCLLYRMVGGHKSLQRRYVVEDRIHNNS
jgi:hypothetical protein